MALEWKNFAMNMKINLRANNLEEVEDKRKVAILLSNIGNDSMNIFYSFDIDMDKISYEDLVQKSEQYFMPKVNYTMERHKLFNRKQRDSEDIATYVTDLKNMSLQCNFGQLEDSLLKDIFSWNLNDKYSYIREKLLIDRPSTFGKAFDIAKNLEASKQQAQVFQSSTSFIGKVHTGRTKSPHYSRSTQRQRSASKTSSAANTNPVCQRCGQVHKFRCPAKGVKCKNCSKYNHFAQMCKSKTIKIVTPTCCYRPFKRTPPKKKYCKQKRYLEIKCLCAFDTLYLCRDDTVFIVCD